MNPPNKSAAVCEALQARFWRQPDGFDDLGRDDANPLLPFMANARRTSNALSRVRSYLSMRMPWATPMRWRALIAFQMFRRGGGWPSGSMVVTGAVLTLSTGSLVLSIAAIALWGIAFGGAATQLRTAMSTVAGSDADLAIAVLTAVFNLAIFGAAAGGAPLVETGSAAGLPLAMAAVSAVTVLTVLLGRSKESPEHDRSKSNLLRTNSARQGQTRSRTISAS